MKRYFKLIILTIVLIAFMLCFAGNTSTGGGFHFSNISISYRTYSWGVLPEQLEYIILSNKGCYPQDRIFDKKTNTFLWTYSNNVKIEFQYKKGETVWIGKDNKIKHCGFLLSMDDFKILEDNQKIKTTTIESPQELMSAIKRIKSEQNEL